MQLKINGKKQKKNLFISPSHHPDQRYISIYCLSITQIKDIYPLMLGDTDLLSLCSSLARHF